MANKQLFANRGLQLATPRPNAVNNAGGQAYSLSDKAALAQFAVTGTFNSTYYVDAADQLKQVEQLAQKCDSVFLAKLAVYARRNGKMKDMPAYLLAVLAARKETELLATVFPWVCNNSKMLCNFVQVIRSGAVGRRSFGTSIKKLIQGWLTSKQAKSLYLASVGHADPSLADVIKMVHPHPSDVSQQNIFAYLLDKPYDEGLLPPDLQVFEALKRGETSEIPDVPFRVLTNCELGVAQWRKVAANMPWDTLRQNLAQLHRKGVFDDARFTQAIADKLADPNAVRNCNVFPYQLLTAYQNTTDLPTPIRNALQQAMEVAVENVPALPGNTAVFVDVSGSMSSPITGRRPGASSVTRCVDIASLIACALLRKNKNTLVLAFDCANSGGWGYSRTRNVRTGLYDPQLNPFDSVMTNANKLAQFGGGGTDCSLPFAWINQERKQLDNIILVSDNESWSGYGGRGGCCAEWVKYSQSHPNAKLVNIDIQPSVTTQTPDRPGKVLNIGGWSDTVFLVMEEFFRRDPNVNFVKVVEETELG